MIARLGFGVVALAILAAVWVASGGGARLTPDECASLYAAALEARDDAAVLDMQARGCDLPPVSPARQRILESAGTVPR